jgi:uncharacterized protein (TIGR00251 family)
MALFTQTDAGVSVTTRVTPRAGRTGIAGVRDDVLLVKLAAAPVDGAANDALIALLSATLHIPKRDITIAAGERSRTKRVVVVAMTAQEMAERLAAVLAG